MLATVADLIAHLQGFPGAQLVMLEAHPGGLISIQTTEIVPAVLGYFDVKRQLPGMAWKQRMVEYGWGPHCPASCAREFPRPAPTPVLVLGCVRPGNVLPPPLPFDPADIEADMRCFLTNGD